MNVSEAGYLNLLSQSYPTAAKAAAEIVRLNGILNLPKETEHFASDIHGEFGAFSHTLRNAVGAIRRAIDDTFGDTLTEDQKKLLATIIYYPKEKAACELSGAEDPSVWLADAIVLAAAVCRTVAGVRDRETVQAAMPEGMEYAIDALLSAPVDGWQCQDPFRAAVIASAIQAGNAVQLLDDICSLTRRLAVDHLHLVGDIYDRGPNPESIVDMLMDYHSLDIQWGNHDVVWMGASLGQRGCIAHVVRNCARYGNLNILEDAYGINIRPLAMFAQEAYKDDPCVAFGLKIKPEGLSEQELDLNVKIQKAMAIIQFKVEAQLIDEYPGFDLESRKLLDKIDYEKGTVVCDGVEYELTDKVFPTVDPADPYRLTDDEEYVMQCLEKAFIACEKLSRHMRFLLEKGSLYKICNGSLMLHACVPLNPDGSLMETDVFGSKYKGRALYDVMQDYIRMGFNDPDPAKRKLGADMMWYMWLGQGSPLFAKSKMATFELYLIAEKEARKEHKNAFYSMMDNDEVMAGIFRDFGLDPENSRIVCGHVPVKVKDGEDPIMCGGKVIRIDGGYSAAYQKTTGIAGFTLVYDAEGIVLASHEPLPSIRAAIEDGFDIKSEKRVVWQPGRILTVADTDRGGRIRERIADLECLLEAYRTGEIQEA